MLQHKYLKLTSIFFFLVFFSYAQQKHNTKRAKRIQKTEKYLQDSVENDSLVANLGYAIQNTIINDDADGYMALFDLNLFGNKITEDTKNDASLNEFRNGFVKGISESLISLPNKLINEVAKESYYDFINYRYDQDEKTYYMLFRLYSAETGINYHNYKVSKLDNKPVFNDIYIYLSGENLSETFKRLYLYNLPKKNLFNLFGKSTADEFLVLLDAVNIYKSGDYITAFKKFNKVKGEIAKDKFTLILKSLCAAQIGDKEYEASIKELIDLYPNDSSLYLTQIDYYIILKNFDKAFELLNRLEEETEDDFLRFLKGNLEYDRKNYKAAIEHFKYINSNYDSFLQSNLSYVCCLSHLDRFEESITELDSLIEKGYEKSYLIEYVEELDENGNNELEKLASSKLYKNWKVN